MNNIKKTIITTSGLYIYITIILALIASAFGGGIDNFGHTNPLSYYIFGGDSYGTFILALPSLLLYFPLKYLIKKSFWKTLLGIFIIFVLPVVLFAMSIYS